MKSGLYACAGASATASAAAWAKRFDEPMTKSSKVYFGLSSTSGESRYGISPSRVRGVVGEPGGGGGRSDTPNATASSRFVVVNAAFATALRKWPSIQSRVKSFGTLTAR